MNHQSSSCRFAAALLFFATASCTPPLLTATSMPTSTPMVAAPGSISGSIRLSSSDPSLWIFAREVNTSRVHGVNPPAGAGTYTINDLPAGTYVVVGWFKPLGVSGAYTSLDVVLAEGADRMRACEEAIVTIELAPGEQYAGADVGCFGGDFFDLAG